MKKLFLGIVVSFIVAVIPFSSVGASLKTPAVQYWYSNDGGQQSINLLSKDLGKVTKYGNEGNLNATLNACAALAKDARSLQLKVPIPQKTLEREWKVILNNYVFGGRTCVEGIATRSSNIVTKAGAQFQKASAVENEMTNQLHRGG